jgi:glycosyltransferase involved in cell wall biosynthesis
MKVLFVCPFVPWPLSTGGKVRTFNLIKEAATHAELHVRILHEPGGTPGAEEALAPHCASLAFFQRTPPGHGTRLLRAKLERWFHSRELEAEIAATIAERRVDLVHLDELLLARSVPGERGIPVVQHHHKLDTVFYGTVSSGIVRHFDLWKLRRLEAESARRYRHHLFCSQEDARVLRRRYGALDVEVVPSGFDPALFTPSTPPAPRAARRLVFLGSMDYAPNVEGVLRFARAVLPRVQAEVPDAVLDVVGRAPTPEVRGLSGASVRILGEVPEVRSHLGGAAALVVPLRIGGGTRLKIVEALALATPTVSTTIGAEGLGLVHGEHLLLADDDAAFAHATIGLLKDPARAAELGARGQAFVHERYRWSALAHDLVDYWERVAFSGASSPSR